MRTFDDVSRLSAFDMDGRYSCLGYDDICDPLGSVLRSGRLPARVLRRRCRSEGVDRSPYDDVNREHSAEGLRNHRQILSKGQFTSNGYNPSLDRFHHDFSYLGAENGDYFMAHEHRHHSYQSSKQKPYRSSPSKPLFVTNKNDYHLPKVEELLEKVDHDMIDVAVTKQPLKSILNNPLPKSPPPGILKKPKSKLTSEQSEGRRRQRASSESDNFYCNYLGTALGYDSKLSYVSGNLKRAKDNSGTGYSYASIPTSSPKTNGTTVPKSPKSPKKDTYNYNKEPIIVMGNPLDSLNVLRTTAINIDTCRDTRKTCHASPTTPCTAPNAALPISSAAVPKKPEKHEKPAKKKVKQKTSKASKVQSSSTATDCSAPHNHKVAVHMDDVEDEDVNSRSPSPDDTPVETWKMDTDSVAKDLYSRDIIEDPPSPSFVAKLSTKLNGALVTPRKMSKGSPLILPDTISNCLRPSLFPRVPPYLRFVAHDESHQLKVPVPIQKHLKWKMTTITPIVVKKTLVNSGFKLVKSECDTAECPQEETVDWIGIWGKHMKSLMFRSIKDGQKMNHFPGTFQVGRKDRLWRNLQKLVNKFGLNEFGIMPKTYVLPADLKLLKHDWEKHQSNNEKWIIKPPASARGTGIKVVSRWTQIPKKRPVIVQKYIAKPYLINGNKFDMRLYVLLTSIHPLRMYLYKDGLARFASVKYNEELTSLHDRYMHLTNYSINRLSKNYTPNEDFAACEGHKWTLHTLFNYLRTEKKVNTDALWKSMKDLVIKTIISGEASISSLTKTNMTSRYNCYELFGIDVLLDEDLKPWLLEVNISPSLHSASPLDIHVKGPLVTTVLNIAQFQVPSKTNLEMLTKDNSSKLAGLIYDPRLYTVYLSKEERDKHIIYTNMETRDMYLRDILSTLTPDDVRHLIQAEDELTQATGEMERVFPTSETYKYLTYLVGPRYYNRLFDAWESRYGHDRRPGVELLRNLCDIGYHLEVPAVPLKRTAPQLSALDRCRMTWMRRRRPPRTRSSCPVRRVVCRNSLGNRPYPPSCSRSTNTPSSSTATTVASAIVLDRNSNAREPDDTKQYSCSLDDNGLSS